jgi:hypothetical protein
MSASLSDDLPSQHSSLDSSVLAQRHFNYSRCITCQFQNSIVSWRVPLYGLTVTCCLVLQVAAAAASASTAYGTCDSSLNSSDGSILERTGSR